VEKPQNEKNTAKEVITTSNKAKKKVAPVSKTAPVLAQTEGKKSHGKKR